MTKSLHILLVGAALIAAAPAFAQGTGGNGGGGGGAGGGGGGGSSNVWDPSIPASRPTYAVIPPTYPPQQQPTIQQRDDTCGQYRGRIYCRPY